MIVEEYNSKVPEKLEDLIKFPGIGINSAIYIQQSVFNIVEGIPVDSQVHKVANLLGWAEAKTTESSRKQLESWLPKEKWTEVSPMLVGFAQSI